MSEIMNFRKKYRLMSIIILVCYIFSYFILIKPAVVVNLADGSSISEPVWRFSKSETPAKQSMLYKPMLLIDKKLFLNRYYEISTSPDRTLEEMKKLHSW